MFDYLYRIWKSGKWSLSINRCFIELISMRKKKGKMKSFFSPNSLPIVTPEDLYGEKKTGICNTCLIIFSHKIYELLLKEYKCSRVSEMVACNGSTPIYTFDNENVTVAFYLSSIGAAMASHQVIEANWLTGVNNFIMFGSAGVLDKALIDNRYIIPTIAFRGEGTSDYFAPLGESLHVPGHVLIEEVFNDLCIPYSKGAIWTTDAFYRETPDLIRHFKGKGCIAVDMELSGVQAVCSFNDFGLYAFLEAGDIVDENVYNASQLELANHDKKKLSIALSIASRLYKNSDV